MPTATVTIGKRVTASATIGGQISASASMHDGGAVYPYYVGDYDFTPTQEPQTIPIIGKVASQNITINPIPSNFGLITWDGSTLTVS